MLGDISSKDMGAFQSQMQDLKKMLESSEYSAIVEFMIAYVNGKGVVTKIEFKDAEMAKKVFQEDNALFLDVAVAAIRKAQESAEQSSVGRITQAFAEFEKNKPADE